MTLQTNFRTARHRIAALTIGTGLAALMVAGAAQAQNAWDAEGFNLEALIAVAKTEPPITAYASSGKIEDIAEAFTAKYGIPANGTKVSSGQQIELMTREGQSGNIVGDVAMITDVPPIMAQLVPLGLVESWVPPDLAATIPAELQNPLVITSSPQVWTYNTEVYQACPVTNIWQLTEPAWARKIAFQDPLGSPSMTDWFNQMEMHFDAQVAEAYAAHFGKPLETTEGSATKAWVKGLAANAPLLTDSDSTVAEAIGAAGQAEPFFGLISTSKYRDIEEENLKMALCTGMAPFSGWLYPGYGVVSTKTDSPNAARLFLHFMMTAEGIEPYTNDGKISANTAVPVNADDPSGVANVLGEIMPYTSATSMTDFDMRQDWQDFWRVNYVR
ncbi:MAG: hypothetical protein RLZZ437_2402 [Pseudomonadota bacterium]|jgi:iron(III) transport system substrate-binding protein